MIFHENPLLANDSHEISYLIFLKKLSSAAVVNGTLRVSTGSTKEDRKMSRHDWKIVD